MKWILVLGLAIGLHVSEASPVVADPPPRPSSVFTFDAGQYLADCTGLVQDVRTWIDLQNGKHP